MAKAQPKPRPMKSRKNGLKHAKRIAANNAILKRFTLFLAIILLVSSCYVVPTYEDNARAYFYRDYRFYPFVYNPGYHYNRPPIILHKARPVEPPRRDYHERQAPIRNFPRRK